MRRIETVLAGLAGLVLIGGLSACGRGGGAGSDARGAGPETGERASWLIETPRADAETVAAAKAGAREGDSIAVRGIIGGDLNALTAGSPVFKIIDTSVENPCLADDGHCQTPWDYCCTPREEVAEFSATVLLVDASGDALDADPVAGGLEPLDEVVVVGTVGPRPDRRVLTIRATAVHLGG